jgi:apolipoprotein N-acyltransferase
VPTSCRAAVRTAHFSRVAVHGLKVPLWLAAPVVWTGLELARAHLLTGFLMASIAHTQVNWPPLIQISDLVGEYGVDFVIVLVAACIDSDFGLRIADSETVGSFRRCSLRQVHWPPS